MMLPLIDLQAQYKKIERQVKIAVTGVLDSGQYIMGNEIRRLERSLSKFTNARYCVSCASGTDALFMALLAKGVGPGCIVFTTPFTFIATAEAIALTGATPVFVDVDKGTFNLDPEQLTLAIKACQQKDSSIYPIPQAVIEQALEPAGVIAVDLFGLPADYDQINKLAHSHGLFVIEDAAQSFGATYKGNAAGNLADIGCTSFFPAKPLGAYGDGGAIFCNDELLKEKLESIRVHGQNAEDKYKNVRLGVTGRLDEIQAAILNVKLSIFPDEVKARQRVSEAYAEGIAGIEDLTVPCVPPGYQSVWAQYTLLAEDEKRREHYLSALRSSEVGCAVYYPISLHVQKVFEYLGYQSEDFPVSLQLSKRAFSLPMHPYLTAENINEVTRALRGN